MVCESKKHEGKEEKVVMLSRAMLMPELGPYHIICITAGHTCHKRSDCGGGGDWA